MKVVRLYSFGDLRVEEEPVPEVSDGEILLKTKACGVCTGEVMPWYIEKKAPLVIGHEPAGVVVQCGKGVKGFKEGDRVFVHHHGPCMGCRFCQRGDYVQCPQWKQKGIYPGGLSEYIRVTEHSLRDTLKLPDSVSYDEATLVEPVACVVKALRRAGIKRGDTVLVIGLG
ncbi:MAG: sorbitol dehydrogenase, partial [Nitrospirae bacterium]